MHRPVQTPSAHAPEEREAEVPVGEGRAPVELFSVLHDARADDDHERVNRAERQGQEGPGGLGEVDEGLGMEVLLEGEVEPLEDGEVLEELRVVRLGRLRVVRLDLVQRRADQERHDWLAWLRWGVTAAAAELRLGWGCAPVVGVRQWLVGWVSQGRGHNNNIKA